MTENCCYSDVLTCVVLSKLSEQCSTTGSPSSARVAATCALALSREARQESHGEAAAVSDAAAAAAAAAAAYGADKEPERDSALLLLLPLLLLPARAVEESEK